MGNGNIYSGKKIRGSYGSEALTSFRKGNNDLTMLIQVKNPSGMKSHVYLTSSGVARLIESLQEAKAELQTRKPRAKKGRKP